MTKEYAVFIKEVDSFGNAYYKKFAVTNDLEKARTWDGKIMVREVSDWELLDD